MKFLLKNNCSIIHQSIFKIILIYFIPLFIYCFCMKIMIKEINEYYILNMLSLNIDIQNNFTLSILMFFITLFSFVYISYLLFSHDLKYQKEFIFLRMKLSRWIIYKTIIISLVILFLYLIKIFIVFYCFNINIIEFIPLIIKGYFYFLMITLLFVFLFVNFKEKFSFLVFILINIFIGINIIKIPFILLLVGSVINLIMIYNIIAKNTILERKWYL